MCTPSSKRKTVGVAKRPLKVKARWHEVNGEPSLFVYGQGAQTATGFTRPPPEAGSRSHRKRIPAFRIIAKASNTHVSYSPPTNRSRRLFRVPPRVHHSHHRPVRRCNNREGIDTRWQAHGTSQNRAERIQRSDGTRWTDRELYLPQVWAEDWERRREAGVPESVGFRTKPQLAQLIPNPPKR